MKLKEFHSTKSGYIRPCSVGERGSNGRTWLKQANVEQNVAQTGEPKRANVEMGKTTFDHLMSGMRFLMQTKCFMLETYVLTLCS